MKNCIFFIVLLFVFSNLFAQVEELSLEEAISIALKSNFEIAKFSVKIIGSKGKRVQMETYPNPEITFSNEGIGSVGHGEREISFGIVQTIELPRRRELRASIGAIEEEIAKEELERTKKIVISRVKKAYFKAAFTKSKIEFLESLKESIENYLDNATSRYQAGLAPLVDVLKGRLELLKLRNEILEAKKTLEEDIFALSSTIGKKFDSTVVLTSPLQFYPFSKIIKNVMDEIESKPSVKIEKLKLQRFETEIRLSEKAIYPDLKLGFFYPSLRNRAWGFEFGFSIPIFRKGVKGVVMETNSYRLESKIALEAKKTILQWKIEFLISSLKSSEEIIKNYEENIFPELEELFLSSLVNYQSGRISSLELLDVFRTLKTIKIEYKREIFNYNFLISEIESAGEED